jgi:cell division protein FtsQ
VIELGRGTEDLLVARTERFVRTLTQVTARWNAPLQYADLRHGDGYAVRLAGVGTQPAAVAGAAPSAAPGPARAAGNN